MLRKGAPDLTIGKYQQKWGIGYERNSYAILIKAADLTCGMYPNNASKQALAKESRNSTFFVVNYDICFLTPTVIREVAPSINWQTALTCPRAATERPELLEESAAPRQLGRGINMWCQITRLSSERTEQ